MTKPVINVTPLIDVLLVLLIIFMVVTPIKPSAFKAKVPSEPTKDDSVILDPSTLVVVVGNDASLRLNGETDLGTVNDPAKMMERLKAVFRPTPGKFRAFSCGRWFDPKICLRKSSRDAGLRQRCEGGRRC